MSPEQMRSTKNVDGRTDLWSLGVILYELVAGRAPFDADTFTALCLKVSMDPPPPLPSLGLRAALPPGFEEVITRALQKDPALRYQSARELAHALAPFGTPQTRERAQRLGGAPGASPASSGPHFVPAAPAQSTLHAATGQVRADTPAPRGRLRRWALAGLGLCAAVGLGIGAGVLRGGGGEVEGGAGLPQTPASPPAPPVATSTPPAEPRPPDPAPDAAVAVSPHDAGSATASPVAPDGGTGARIAPADARRGSASGNAGPRPGASSIDPFEHSE
jgi:serine/threonine-protein kinase